MILSASSVSNNPIRIAIISCVSSSLAEPAAILKYLMNSLRLPRAAPSAILEGMDKAHFLIWSDIHRRSSGGNSAVRLWIFAHKSTDSIQTSRFLWLWKLRYWLLFNVLCMALGHTNYMPKSDLSIHQSPFSMLLTVATPYRKGYDTRRNFDICTRQNQLNS